MTTRARVISAFLVSSEYVRYTRTRADPPARLTHSEHVAVAVEHGAADTLPASRKTDRQIDERNHRDFISTPCHGSANGRRSPAPLLNRCAAVRLTPIDAAFEHVVSRG